MSKQIKGRRALLASLGTVAAAGAFASKAGAQGTTTPAFAPTLHAEDAWMSGIPGKHRVVMDVTTLEKMPDVVRFVSNLFTAYKSGYAVDAVDLAIVVLFRHGATAMGYADAIWAKYGKSIDARATPPPTTNPFNAGGRTQLADMAKQGVQFMVCGTASRNLAGRIAGQGGNADAVMKEMAENLIPGSRIVPAGVISVTHAQERGFALLYVG